MLFKDKELPELFYMKHRHDDDTDFVDYENIILDKTLSPYIYENDMMNGFLKRLQPLIASLFDQMNLAKNFRNIMVDKYYYKHNK
jgi:hypothetical protein